MIVYHEVDRPSLKSILHEGLKKTSRGEKGSEPAIAKTDKLLDSLRPSKIREANVCREDNLYAFFADGTKIIDITDGRPVAIDTFVKNSQQVVLRLHVDPKRCYVSDLDIYDNLKRSIEAGEAVKQRQIAQHYWSALVPFSQFQASDIKRPEIMITYDIEPEKIEVVS